MPRKTVLIAALAFLLLAPTVALGQSDPIHYLYDDLNRLAAVVDAQGNVATYAYDAVGNLLAIARIDAPGSEAVAITLVSPKSGKVGTKVAIFGKGFSATAAENTVTFNGTSATVTEATTHRLVTSVPIGATTGPINLTTPLGSASWSTFTVVSGGLTVLPASVGLIAGASQGFEASQGGTPATNVTWSVNGIPGGDATVGTIATTGIYTSPTRVRSSGLRVAVGAVHKDDATVTGSASVLVVPPIAVGRAVSAVVTITNTVDKSVVAKVSARIGGASTLVDKNVVPVVSAKVGEAGQGTVDKSLVALLSAKLGDPPPTQAGSPLSVSVTPVVTVISPAAAEPGASNLSITLTGVGLANVNALTFLSNGAIDTTITATNVVARADGTTVTADISITATAATGGRVVTVTAPEGSSTAVGTGGNAFTVQ